MTPGTELMDAQHLAEWLIKRLALRGWRCEDSERFDAALKRTEQKLKEQVKQ